MAVMILSKICTECKRELPATPEFFWRDKYAKDGFMSQCKECKKEYNRSYRRMNRERLKTYEKSRSKGREIRTKRYKTEIMKDNPLQITYNSIHQYIRRHKNKPKYLVLHA